MRPKIKPTLTWILLILLGAAMFIPVPYVMTSPGPVFNTIGTVDEVELISISGTQTYQTEGELDMTTVSEYGGPQQGLDMFQAILGWLNPDKRVVPRESIYPEGETEEQNMARNAEAFSTSQSYAIAAAMDYLKQPINEKVIITSVGLDTPAQNKLRAGDEILAIDGVPMKTPEQVVAAVRSKPIGTALTFSVVRSDSKLDVVVTSGTRQDDPTTNEDESKLPYIGIGIDISYSANYEIDFGVTGVGGPSAGTMFAIGIIDKLTPGALTQGKTIAGTGTIDPKGNVGEIGGIQQKLIGARDAGAVLFLAPQGNCSDVVGHIPDGLTVAAVKTLDEAMAAINTFNSGKPVTPCFE
ncbi:MAG: PDZ domain-containing protein [Actinobacteria bacterium]|nr:PDZ domain-containing protein [Actinomycetota bacterium]NBO35230.1 PDZ domain-containing protein [Actinomycetota bacterium]